MEYIFEDVLEIKNGKNQKAVENPKGQYPIYGSGGVMGYADDYICEADTVVIGRKGSINNPIYVSEPFWNVDTAFGLSAKRNILLPRYLFYFCKKLNFEELNKTVTIPSLTKSDLLKVKIDLPEISIQQEVIDKLSKIESIINLRKNELVILNDLIKARFVKMFGDTKTNNMGWNQVQLKDIAEVRGRVGWKGYKKEDLREEGPLVLGATHLTDNGEIDLSVPVHLSKEKYEESPEIFLQKGDLIFTQRGNTIGKVGLIENDIGEATINPCVLILRPINIHPIYFKSYFVMDATKNDMWKLNSGSAQPMITQKGIGEYIMTVPPLELQNQFADFVKEVEKSKVAVQQALDKAQLLFDSLMQQYFG